MGLNTIGYLLCDPSKAHFDETTFLPLIQDCRRILYIILDPQKKQFGLAEQGTFSLEPTSQKDAYPLIAILPALYPEWLGDASYRKTHQVRFNYVGGAMARGIASAALVIELARLGMLGFFGAAGLPPDRVEKEILGIKSALNKGQTWGANLIHSPQLPGLEEAITDLYLHHGIHRVEASAFMTLSSNIVRYSSKGLYKDSNGKICRRNYVFAKISREEVARHFLLPPPNALLESLQNSGKLTEEEVALARQIPICEDITVESDSGGHTDNRPLNALFSAIIELRNRITNERGYQTPIRIGAAGSLGTPQALASAFALGADYVLMGSVHQCSKESGLSTEGKQLLMQAGIADVMMTASADMFEMGVKVQILKRGTLMGVRGNQLYELYMHHNSIDEIPVQTRENLEKNVFRRSIQSIWEETEKYFEKIDPPQIALATKDPRHKMALIFRWYLGHTSRWPILGTVDRKTDYQIWCGPALGAFNSWVKDSFLEALENRSIQQIALNLMEGAAQITRAHQLRTYGFPIPVESFSYRPAPLNL